MPFLRNQNRGQCEEIQAFGEVNFCYQAEEKRLIFAPAMPTGALMR